MNLSLPHRLYAPSFVLLMASLAASLLLFAAPTRAGTYTWTTTDPSTGKVTAQSPSFSGGVVNVVTSLHAPGKSNTFPPTPFSTSSGHYQGSGGCQANSNNANNMQGSVKVNSPAKPLVATFTWQATSSTDLPPPAVIVQQNCTASWSLGTYTGTATATGSADCGLPGASVSTATNSSEATTGMTSSGGQYSAVSSPGASFSIPVSGSYQPTASTAATSGSSGVSDSTASVDYQVQAFPVFINPGGATPDSSGNYNILVGQGCTASLSSLPCPVSGWQWSVSGPTFQQWSTTTPPIGTNPANPNASYEVDGYGPSTNSTAHWYWNDPSNTTETVSCTATVTPPVGQGAAFPVTVTQKVLVVVPPHTFDQVEGAVGVITYQNVNYLAAAGTSAMYPRGETWTCSVQTPTLFGAGGSCNLCQTITPSRSHTFDTGTISCTQNGKTGLDLKTPYAADPKDPYTVGTGANAGWPADNSQHSTGDVPKTAVMSDDGLKTANSIQVHEQFVTTLMYIPPGSDVQPVSLGSKGWGWDADASKPAAGWVPGAGTLGTVSKKPVSGTNVFPSWPLIESVFVGSGW